METYEIKLKSPMGWIKADADLTMESDTTFGGEVRLMGTSAPICNGVKNGTDYSFSVAVKLPFGMLNVAIDVTVQPDGSVTGVANADRHKPMEIVGQRLKQTA